MNQPGLVTFNCLQVRTILLLIFPLLTPSEGAQFAIEDLNADPSILPNTKLKLTEYSHYGSPAVRLTNPRLLSSPPAAGCPSGDGFGFIEPNPDHWELPS